MHPLITLLAAVAAPLQEVSLPAGDAHLERLPADTPRAAPAFAPGTLAAATATLLLDEPGDGRVWARGRSYKASFGVDGFTYVPFLGSDAPRNYPVEFDLEGVTLAGDPLPLGAPERPALAGETVTLGHGVVDEVYHLSYEAIEQTFVFDALPARGELRVRLDVASDLEFEARRAGFALGNHLGEVRYGAATAIDAEGRTLALEQRWTNGVLELVVPAGFVEAAALPLVVDPIISTFAVTNDARRQLDVDTAFDTQNNTYQIVYSEVFSATDRDVLSVFYNASLGLLVQPSSIDITSEYWAAPRTANAHFDETFLAVAVVGVDPAARRVWARTRHAGTGNRGAQFGLSSFGVDHVDVGGFGNDTATTSDFLVVWQVRDLFVPSDWDIRGQRVSSDGSPTGLNISISTGNGHQDQRPSISKSSGRAELLAFEHRYMVVWDREDGPTNHDVMARVIDYDGDLVGHDTFLVHGVSDARNADVSTQAELSVVASNEPYWAVVYERKSGANYDIYVTLATDGDTNHANNVTEMQDVDRHLDQRDPAVAFDGQDYLVAYLSADGNGGEDAYFTALNAIRQDGGLRSGLALRREALRTVDGEATVVAISSHYDGGGPVSGGLQGEALTVWIADEPNADEEVGGTVVAEISSYVAGSQFCSAEPNASGATAWIKAKAGFVDPTTDLDLVATDLPLDAFGYFIVSSQTGFTSSPGGSIGNLCLAGSIGRYAGSIENSGSLGWVSTSAALDDLPQPFGAVSAMSGEWWHFQYWTRDHQNGAPTSNFSNGVSVWVN